MISDESDKKYFVTEEQSDYGNPVVEKSFKFAVDIVNFYKNAIKSRIELESILRQILRSGTSIVANISEAQYASSKKDLIIS